MNRKFHDIAEDLATSGADATRAVGSPRVLQLRAEAVPWTLRGTKEFNQLRCLVSESSEAWQRPCLEVGVWRLGLVEMGRLGLFGFGLVGVGGWRLGWLSWLIVQVMFFQGLGVGLLGSNQVGRRKMHAISLQVHQLATKVAHIGELKSVANGLRSRGQSL